MTECTGWGEAIHMRQRSDRWFLQLCYAMVGLAVVALAIEQGKNATGRAIADNIPLVANPPGEEVSDLGEALRLIREGQDINYQGTSGDIAFDENGDVSGSFIIWTVAENGSIVQGEKVAV